MFPPSELRDLVERVAAVAGVVAVTLGGSRAAGTEHAASDWDFCVFYRGMIDIEAIRAFGYTGDFYEPGSWGRLLNGGAWLSIGDTRADLLYRDLDFVEHCIAEAEAGRFEIDEARGFVAGLPSYFLVGEVALGRPLIGSLPRAVYPEALRTRAATRWQAIASFSLWEAEQCARAANQQPAPAYWRKQRLQPPRHDSPREANGSSVKRPSSLGLNSQTQRESSLAESARPQRSSPPLLRRCAASSGSPTTVEIEVG